MKKSIFFTLSVFTLLALGLAFVGPIMIAGSMSLRDIVTAQQPVWFIFYQPLGAAIFTIATIAEVNRAVEVAMLGGISLSAEEQAKWKKAVEPVVLDLREIASFTDFFVIATGTSPRQMRTVADDCIEAQVSEPFSRTTNGSRASRDIGMRLRPAWTWRMASTAFSIECCLLM